MSLTEWIERHLWAILAVAFALYGGYKTGEATTEARFQELERRMDAVEAKQSGRFDFMTCSVRNMDKVFDKLGVQPACPMEVPE